MLFTLGGWAISMPSILAFLPAPDAPTSGAAMSSVLLIPLSLWMLWEAHSIGARRGAIRDGFRNGYWALSIAVLLIALASGLCKPMVFYLYGAVHGQDATTIALSELRNVMAHLVNRTALDAGLGDQAEIISCEGSQVAQCDATLRRWIADGHRGGLDPRWK